jgi:hypothetical protein
MEVSGRPPARAALPLERVPGTQRIRGWVGPGADLEPLRKTSRPCRHLNPLTSGPHPWRYTCFEAVVRFDNLQKRQKAVPHRPAFLMEGI